MVGSSFRPARGEGMWVPVSPTPRRGPQGLSKLGMGVLYRDLRQSATGNTGRSLPGFETGNTGNRGGSWGDLRQRLPGFEAGKTGQAARGAEDSPP